MKSWVSLVGEGAETTVLDAEGSSVVINLSGVRGAEAHVDRAQAFAVDPMARKITYKDKGGRFNGYIHPRAVITNPKKY